MAQLLGPVMPATHLAEHGYVADSFHYFICSVRMTAEDPVVLVLDGCYSKIRNTDVINSG
jgi:hypothetical protein